MPLQSIPMRLCDDAGMVSDEPVAAGFPGSQYALTYRQLLNNGRAANGDPDHRRPYSGEPFPCTGSFHVAGVVWRCTSPAHAVRPQQPDSMRRVSVAELPEIGADVHYESVLDTEVCYSAFHGWVLTCSWCPHVVRGATKGVALDWMQEHYDAVCGKGRIEVRRG